MAKEKIVINYTPLPFKQKLLKTCQSTPTFLRHYFVNLFPIITWIYRYNLTWLVQDIVAGITVGIVLVPQGMAYAKIANLPPQYGLYTSFVGSSVYCLFGTSKDISVGPISTISLLLGSAIHTVTEKYPEMPPAEVGISLALFCGIVMVIMSILRLGIFIDFISEPAIAGYMTGSAITIVLNQCPKLFGIKGVSTHDAPYKVLANFLVKLSSTHLDLAFGLSSLVFLYAVRFICGRFKCKSPIFKKLMFLFGIMRNGLIVIISTFVSFMVNRNKEDIAISVIKSVPAGFDAIGIPKFHMEVIREASSVIPSIILISVLEHVSVGKSFGRISGYQVNPDQEILAVGISNILNPFFGGFSCTGAFSRTAIMARSGSRTPIAGVFSGAIVVLALYVLTPAFYYIPEAVLSAVIIHAVSDLASKPKYLKALWSTSVMEFLVWTTAVITTIFVDIETGIYAAVGLSLIIMLYRLARPPIKIISRITVDDHKTQHQVLHYADCEKVINNGRLFESERQYLFVDEKDTNFIAHTNNLPSGVLILRLCDSILYPNAEYTADTMINIVRQRTRNGNIADMNKKDSQRNWNEPKESQELLSSKRQLPVLQAIIIDFTAVSHLDATAVEALITTRDTLDRYAGHSVEWHFSGIQHQSIRSKLVHAGFGSLPLDEQDDLPSLVNTTSDEEDNCSFETLASPTEKLRDTSRQAPIAILKDFLRHSPRCDSPAESIKFEMPEKAIKTIPNNSIYAQSPGQCHEKPTDLYLDHIPVDAYPCFHWHLDSAVRSISDRLIEKKKHIQLDRMDTDAVLFV